MSNQSNPTAPAVDKQALYQATAAYQQADLGKAVWQLINTFVPYIALWALMVYTVQQGYPYWITLALAVPAAGLMVRVFIFFHDCGHQSFFASRRANRVLGYITGILTFTPYGDWSHSHGVHHATAGNLDRRGTGDVWTMTVEEYQAAPRLKRLGYRLFRNPLVMFGLGPLWMFLVVHRFAHKGANRRDRLSVWFTNVIMLAIIVGASLTIGFWTYVAVQLPILWIGGAAGIWLFYVQHQFEGVYWARQEAWDPVRSALEGSSFYKLPKVLQWFSGNIGFHHIHHIRPRIPNYTLQRAYEEVAALQATQPLTVRRSLDSLRMNLWDEERQRLVSFQAV
jgi:omega-6 fatty acid desaturase (delta-12 desaturase)